MSSRYRQRGFSSGDIGFVAGVLNGGLQFGQQICALAFGRGLT